MQTAFNQSNRKGFTLIELLVVIAIISILAAILFPVFARARENARRASCQSNLKQIALGIMQYSQDYDESFPLAVTVPTTASLSSGVPYGWADAIQPYLKSTQIFQCPSEVEPPSSNPDDIATSGSYNDYWYNRMLHGTAQAAVAVVAQTVMNGDGNGNSARYNSNGCTSNAGNSGSSTVIGLAGGATGTCATAGIVNLGSTNMLGRHLDGANYAFVDGHVKWLKGTAGNAAGDIFRSSAVYNSAVPAADAGGRATFSID